jgi:ribonucleoside-diphosphate reductase alpha chain
MPRSAISDEIWDMKYRFKRADGAIVDTTIEDTWRRVATALAEAEKPAERAQWADRFFSALEGYKFLPAGRILAGAGTGRAVTLFNCFVMGTVADDLSGIFDGLKESALTMQQGGGIGCDFSSLRPLGAPVRGVGADASGPLSFMDVWDAMCRTIMSAGSRRGAMMATMACDHPDIEAFIEAKRDPHRLRMFNLSVLVSDAFMSAVERGDDWPLMFAGTCFKTVNAAELWDKIMRSTYDYAEPGVIFIDRVNGQNNLAYCETIRATNPCVTADTWVHTAEGPRRVIDLVGRPFEAMVDGATHTSSPEGFFSTSVKPVLKLTTTEGPQLRLTADHPVRKVMKRTRWTLDWQWTKAGDIERGDEVLLGDHRRQPNWQAAEHADDRDSAAGYLLGLLIGDGTLKSDSAVLSAWPGASVVNGGHARPGVASVMREALRAAESLPHRSDFSGWAEVPERGEYRLKMAALRDLAFGLDLVPGRKSVTPAVEM